MEAAHLLHSSLRAAFLWPVTDCIQPAPTEQTEVANPSPPPQLPAIDCSQCSSFHYLFTRTVPAANSQTPLPSPHPKAAKLLLKTEWHAWQKNALPRGPPYNKVYFGLLKHQTHIPHPPTSRKAASSATRSLYVFIAQEKNCQATQGGFLYSRKPASLRPVYSVLMRTHIQTKQQSSLKKAPGVSWGSIF